MKLGFTGTRQGMTDRQLLQLRMLMPRLRAGLYDEFHHGDADGADKQAAAEVMAFKSHRIVPHPAGKDPLKRNREIVAAVDVLIAAPRTDEEEVRSGTWATVRYARQAGIPVIMLTRGGK